ncbi:hypothetical protein BU24DRAFT_376671 [Aaosphaeria arxii CBS 175.79]|uniref:Utp8 beta-propeller domain-containing protein n=1 Tax=Aaosphaeria arxii CBS 175.79 TaxID=1450172 RepID=A0A6A5XF29_9PLEO|nr:uncharacterized protein BU24DRAFT_376671 [Aaosphaeria arxii CBS 175.79]KAF2011469.1 hypothetical protein BU24DRAFT_376671 [Aaosphaeria arxii CBS 175.79]
MSSTQEIGAPFTIASLPHPINAVGRTQAACVFSINGTKKRKRTEVVVGVDGEGILVYSVQNPQLVTSYALPPQTSFASAPHSLYRRRSSKGPAYRHTYAAISQPASTDSQLLCFAESTQKDGTSDTVKTTFVLSDKVVAIDSYTVSDGSHDVIVVLQNGRIQCLSANLEEQRWESNVQSLLPPFGDALEIEYVACTTGKAAIDGLLKNREDIAVILDSSLAGDAEILDLTPVLCIIFRRSNHQRSLGIFQLQPRSPDSISNQLSPVKQLLTWTLAPHSSSSVKDTAVRHYALHASSGVLHELAGSQLISYDLTSTTPRIYSSFQAPDAGMDTLLRISTDLVFAASGKTCGLFDVKYSSVQALHTFEHGNAILPESKKRKQSEPKPADKDEVSPTLVTYFSELKLVVSICKHDLVGTPLSGTIARKRPRTTGSLLIDSIGKGIGHVYSEKEMSEWKKRAQKLSKQASKGNVADFEESFAQDLDIPLSFDASHNAIESSNGVADDSSAIDMDGEGDTKEKALRKWQLPAVVTESQRYRHRPKALFALSRIFQFTEPATESPGQGSLKIVFFPPNVFQWLLLSGFVTKESIRRALLEYGKKQQGLTIDVLDGDIVKSIIKFDPELHILSAVLNHSHFLPVGEVVHAIGALIHSLDERPDTEGLPRLLTNGHVRNGAENDDMDVDLDSEIEAAAHDLDHALSMLDNGLLVRSHTLRPALIRLHTFPVPVVSSALRSNMSRQALKSLIKLLHSELRNGGWTSSYDFVESGTVPGAEDPENQAVAIIASLLSCALDAVGTSAWLSFGASDSQDAEDETIEELLFDTSAALNGFWEARFMRGLLSEFLRYASNSAQSQKPTSQRLQKQGKPFMANATKDGELPMLPLGGKPDMGIEKKKTGKGGKKEERSAREMGMLISKRVPKYSFERIVL